MPTDGWTAVVRGALLKTLGETAPGAKLTSVISRVARKHYGMIISTSFVKGVHDTKKK